MNKSKRRPKHKQEDRFKKKSLRFSIKKERKTQINVFNSPLGSIGLSKFAPSKFSLKQPNLNEIQEKILKYVNINKSTRSSKDWISIDNSKKEDK